MVTIARIAIIADIHANVVALEAVLRDLGDRRIDQIVCLGDVAATGPQPREALRAIRHVGCLVVMGNADAWLLTPVSFAARDATARRWLAIDSWCREQLDADDFAFVATCRPTLDLPLVDGQTLRCFHGSPRSNREALLATTPDATVVAALGDRAATVFAGGHTHEQLLRRVGGALLINPGSVGLPFERAAGPGAAVGGVCRRDLRARPPRS